MTDQPTADPFAPIRHTLDTLTSGSLCAIYDSLDAAEAALDRVRAALASFKGRGVLSIGHVNLDIPTAGEVLDAVRAALNEASAPAQPCTGECDPTSGAFNHAATCYEDRERTGRNAGLVFPATPTTVPCPACRRADQAGLAPAEQHPDCAKEQH